MDQSLRWWISGVVSPRPLNSPQVSKGEEIQYNDVVPELAETLSVKNPSERVWSPALNRQRRTIIRSNNWVIKKTPPKTVKSGFPRQKKTIRPFWTGLEWGPVHCRRLTEGSWAYRRESKAAETQGSRETQSVISDPEQDPYYFSRRIQGLSERSCSLK